MTQSVLSRSDCEQMDGQDSLAPLRNLFHLPQDLIYLDGNSLGALPSAAASRLKAAITQEWGESLIRGWNDAGWHSLPERVGNKIAPLIGAKPGEVVVTDSTSINLFKVLSCALNVARQQDPKRLRIVSERSNFPTDLYIAQGLCREKGYELVLVEKDEMASALTDEVAVLMLTHVNYRTGHMHDMAALNAQAHQRGILTVWDLAHSAGAVCVDLHAANADFAVGCGYKYLNGGPGAPAFVWSHPRLVDWFWQPLSGWWGHRAPFAFVPDYVPAAGIQRYLCGTQPILSLIALDAGLDTLLAAQSLGGMPALRQKSLALTGLFMQLVRQQLQAHGFSIQTPQEASMRGSHVSLSRPEGGYAIVQALIARGVIGDFRSGDPTAPPTSDAHSDLLRFGFTPLYMRHVDVWDAVAALQAVMTQQEWMQPRFAQRHAVT